MVILSGTSERRRVTLCAAVGLVAASAAAFLTVWQLAALIGWIVTATVFLAWVWGEIGRLDATMTARVARREDDSRVASGVVLVVSSAMSLVVVVAALARASSASGPLLVALAAASLVSVVLSWLVVHTVFVLRYAHLFYGAPIAGGVEFPGDEAPSYQEFAYLAFTVGMTFQVSDTAVSRRPIRATVLRHALLSYLFSVAIIAVTINLVAGLVS